MNRRLTLALFLTVLVPLAGCHRKVKAAAAPPPPPVEMVSVPPPTHPTEPLPEEPTEKVAVTPAPVIAPKKITPPRRKSSTPPVTPPPTQTAAVAPAPIDLGQLTTGGEETNNALRQQTEDLMRSQGRRLVAIPTSVAALHSQQVEQVRLYLRQADEAWKKLDIDGARTLATKAKVLLDEILE